MGMFSKIFGSNEKEIKKFQPILDTVNSLAEGIKKLSDIELKAKTEEFRARLKNEENLDDILPEAFAVVREAADRVIHERHYDVQILGGIALHKGLIAEMKTGEGKTLTSTLAIYLNALTKKGVHVVTVNDYLAKRDCNWMGSIFDFLGISSACIIHDASFIYTPKIIDENEVTIELENLKPITRREAYQADVTYGTNNEFGFDYLRDNMVQDLSQMSQRDLNFAIIDEADSILIDEARTPLIISAPDTESTKLYDQFAHLIPRLKKEEDYQVDEKAKAVSISEKGIEKIEKWLGVDNIYEAGKMNYVHHLEQALKAEIIFQRDKDYVVKDNEVIIVDDFTGRLMQGRRYSEGLHQAIEAKEGVRIQKESKTLATITFQNYFRMYKKMSGMTGTALTSAEEFFKVYEVDVIEIPTNKPMVRKDLPDVIYKSEEGKFQAIAQKIKELNKTGQPFLVGTIAIEKSEYLSSLLTREGVSHEVLNAKNHEREALIVSKAGELKSVTIATNMAGRGTDIKLGKNVKEAGGLYIIGTERHEARRIDNQLRGRAGRQGDPGASQFYISLEDELMRRFGGDKLFKMMSTLGLPEDQPIQNKIISRSIENAQSKIEGFNFDLRKHILEYDDVMNKQREVIYKKRKEILSSENVKNIILENVQEEIEKTITNYCVGEEGEWKIKELINQFKTVFIVETNLESKLKEIQKNKQEDVLGKIGKLNESIFQEAKEAYNRKEKELGENNMRMAERMIYLRTIDTAWMNHLSEMDYLRDSVGLRGYGQRDPLLEYKREAFNMFAFLLDNIRQTIVGTIFKIAILAPEQSSAEQNNLNFQGAQEVKQFGSLNNQEQPKPQENKTSQVAQQPIINKDKIGRNDPCPCGSGKKYKRCCGA